MALWDGRFDGSPNELMQQFGESITIDLQMWKEDILGSKAHSEMLFEVGLLTEEERTLIHKGLDQVASELEAGWIPGIELEDIHMAVETRLSEIIGATAGKLHTARSRNDQVATDVRLWLRARMQYLSESLGSLVATLTKKATQEGKVLVPGYTHMQRGQPIWFAHQLLAHAWAFSRDQERVDSSLSRINRSPLGAAAMAGTPHPIDRMRTAELLHFDGVVENAMDAVATRDHQQEAVSCCAIAASNLSRLATELVLWSSTEFSRIRLGDSYSTGSSIMPQKRNPDAPELIRGKTARVYGSLHALLTLTKGLPMAYNRDFQEDREALFDAVKTVLACTKIMDECIAGMDILEGPDLEGSPLLATELADYLVSKGLPFRDAHHVVGRIVKHCEVNNIGFHHLGVEGMKSFHEKFDQEVLVWIDPVQAAERRTSRGGTAWSEVERQAILLLEKVEGSKQCS